LPSGRIIFGLELEAEDPI